MTRIQVGSEFVDHRYRYRVWQITHIEASRITLARFYRVNKTTGHSFGKSRSLSVDLIHKRYTVLGELDQWRGN